MLFWLSIIKLNNIAWNANERTTKESSCSIIIFYAVAFCFSASAKVQSHIHDSATATGSLKQQIRCSCIRLATMATVVDETSNEYSERDWFTDSLEKIDVTWKRYPSRVCAVHRICDAYQISSKRNFAKTLFIHRFIGVEVEAEAQNNRSLKRCQQQCSAVFVAVRKKKPKKR